jgi:sugar-specific transcriptional regulator TrmB
MAENTDHVRSILTEYFGLSSYEADVYVSLVRNGKQSMSEIASTSDVPRQRVYDVTETLRTEGLIEILDESPKKAYAIPPAEALANVQEQIDQAVSTLDELHKTNQSVGGDISMFRNEVTINKYIEKIIRSTEVTVALVVPFEQILEYSPLLREVQDEITLKLIVSNTPEEVLQSGTVDPQSLRGLSREVKAALTEEPIVISVDRSVGFLWFGYGTSRNHTQSQGYYITNSQLATLLDRFIVELLWTDAPILCKRESLPDLPQTFLRIRDCVDTINQHTSQGSTDSIMVEVEGYHIETRTQASISGQLIDYYESTDYKQTYMVVDIGDEDGEQESNVVTVGGWNATVEDYEAHRISLYNQSDQRERDSVTNVPSKSGGET